jgi:3',5'-cyclic AMP phosphodiesterase CpdA
MLIAHLSDPHLRAQGHLYQGLIDSNAMFEAALRQLDALDPQPDLVLLSGDVVDDGTAADYGTATRLLSRIRQPLVVIPGNHDEREAFRHCFRHHPYLTSSGPLHAAVGDHGPVRILGLDVTVPGAHHGAMDDAACAWLEERLAEAPDRPTIVMMHQPPFDSGMAYIDAYHCRQGARLGGIVSHYPAVERILCGHVHRHICGTLLVTAPSTTTAIALRLSRDAEPASFIEPPAMLLHHWQQATGLITHLVPIGTFPGPFDFF